MARRPRIGVWFKHIVADRHEVSKCWVLWYLTDAEAAVCREALNEYHKANATKGTVG